MDYIWRTALAGFVAGCSIVRTLAHLDEGHFIKPRHDASVSRGRSAGRGAAGDQCLQKRLSSAIKRTANSSWNSIVDAIQQHFTSRDL